MNGSKIPFPNAELWKAIFYQTINGVINRQNKYKSWYKVIRNKTTYWNKLDFYYMLNSVIVICVTNYVNHSLKPVNF